MALLPFDSPTRVSLDDLLDVSNVEFVPATLTKPTEPPKPPDSLEDLDETRGRFNPRDDDWFDL